MAQEVGLNRNSIDKYYTKPSIVDLCMDAINQYIHVDSEDLII